MLCPYSTCFPFLSHCSYHVSCLSLQREVRVGLLSCVAGSSLVTVGPLSSQYLSSKCGKLTVLYKFIAWNQIKVFRSTHLSTMSIFLMLGKMRVVSCHAISCLVNIYLLSSICAQSSHKDVQRRREAEIIQRFLFFLKCLKWNIWKKNWRSLMKNMKKYFFSSSFNMQQRHA